MSVSKQFALTASQQIPGWCYANELSIIYDITKQSKRHVEIGVYCGRSLFASACAMGADASILAIDSMDINHIGQGLPYDGWVEDMLTLTLKAIKKKCSAQVKFLKMTSIEAATAHRNATFDTIYIDGDHSHDGVMSDIESWLPLLRDGGVMFGHDYWPKDHEVMDAVNAAFGQEFTIMPNTRIWAYTKRSAPTKER